MEAEWISLNVEDRYIHGNYPEISCTHTCPWYVLRKVLTVWGVCWFLNQAGVPTDRP